MTPLAFFQTIGMPEIMLLMVLALILFGARKLPELGRSLGKGIVEFKKGIKGLEDDVETTGNRTASAAPEAPRPPQRIGGASPKFEERATDSHGQPRDI